ncbi:hypothetical protein [Cerasicoccus frondis]|uniref:hypothetical protein n=1 Tax=Cerasicoccus frondis TaxID=490090 RepID=UPI0028525AB8|nr:hypothetical protein [Cerasicoccus frondis]
MKQPCVNDRSSKGFALIIAISLMAMLVLLVISISTITRVELQTALFRTQKEQSRANALLALSVAMGELQKYAGADQRITTRADIDAGNTANPYWTGVYGAASVVGYDATPVEIANELTDPTLVATNGSSAKLLNWLVSGNEETVFSPSDDIGPTGAITNYPAADEIRFNPGSVESITAATDIEDDIQLTDQYGVQTPARIVVGAGSVDEVADFVTAPLVDVRNSEGMVEGAYAWWVGEEGVKANITMPLEQSSTQKQEAFLNATRTAVELMAKNDAPELDAERIGELYDATDNVDNLATIDELVLASGLPNEAQSAIRFRFHDMTTDSMSLLTDSYAGGVKRDLSILLDNDFVLNASDPTANSEFLFVPHLDDGSNYAIPTWGHLRSFYNTRVPTTGTDAYSLLPRLPIHDKNSELDDVGVAPVLTYFSMGFRVAPGSIPAAGVDINLNLYPLVVLWNPYNFTLKAPTLEGGGNYEVGIYPTYNVKLNLEVLDDDTGEWAIKSRFDFLKDSDGNNSNHEFFRFRLNCPDIPPGQSLIFCLPIGSSGDVYTGQNVLENISPEVSAHVSIPLSTFDEGEEDNLFRVAPNTWHETPEKTHYFGSSFSNGGGGELFTYLGKPVATRVSANTNTAFDPAESNREWYQTNQRVGWDNILVVQQGGTSVQQVPQVLAYYDPSVADEPAFVFLMQALFSGYGLNEQILTNQHDLPSRWVAQGNMRALRTSRTRRDRNYNVLFTATAGSQNVNTPWHKFLSDDNSEGHRASAGFGHDWVDGAPQDAVLFEFPYEDQHLYSIGQLQHANLSFIGAYPSYPIGNSLADFRLHAESGPMFSDAPDGYQLARVDHVLDSNNNLTGLAVNQKGYYDISFLLNRMLWDQYYMSALAMDDVAGATPPFERHVVHETVDWRDPDVSASGLMLKGGFNINSTSEQAWRAVLGAVNQLEYNPITGATATGLDSAFSRYYRPTADNEPGQIWNGYRTLTPEQIAQLAHFIVEEIKNRGPFTSVSDFVNRRLVDNPATEEDETLSGVIQAAINRASIAEGADFTVNDPSLDAWYDEGVEMNVDYVPNIQPGYVYNAEQFWGGDTRTSTVSNRSAFAPKHLTQADVLSLIGSSITARSDTFVIRAYGESNDPLSGEVRARSWCEALVQRLPEYVDSNADQPEDSPTTLLNQKFGRKFKIISFKWLTPEEV